MPDPTPRRLTRAALSVELTARGFPITKIGLDKLSSQGSGPPYSRWGKHAVYDLDAALAWAEGRLRPAQKAA